MSEDGAGGATATVADPRVVLAAGELEVAVLGLGHEVLVRSESVRLGAELDAKVGRGLLGEGGEARGGVVLATSGAEEGAVGRRGDVEEGRAGVDDAAGPRGEGGRAVGEAGDADAPVGEGAGDVG